MVNLANVGRDTILRNNVTTFNNEEEFLLTLRSNNNKPEIKQ